MTMVQNMKKPERAGSTVFPDVSRGMNSSVCGTEALIPAQIPFPGQIFGQ